MASRRHAVYYNESPPGSRVTVLSTVCPPFFHLLIHFGWSNALICLCSLKRWRVSAAIPIVRWQPGSPVKAVISVRARLLLNHPTPSPPPPPPPHPRSALLSQGNRLTPVPHCHADPKQPRGDLFGWEATLSAFATIHLQEYASPHRSSGGWEMCKQAGGGARHRRKAAVIEHREMEAGDPMRS